MEVALKLFLICLETKKCPLMLKINIFQTVYCALQTLQSEQMLTFEKKSTWG